MKGTYTLKEMLETLNGLPKGLNELYSHLLTRVIEKIEEGPVTADRQRMYEAILKWLTFASRPMTLAELSAAISKSLKSDFHVATV